MLPRRTTLLSPPRRYLDALAALVVSTLIIGCSSDPEVKVQPVVLDQGAMPPCVVHPEMVPDIDSPIVQKIRGEALDLRDRAKQYAEHNMQKEALDVYKECLAKQEAVFGPNGSDLAFTLQKMGLPAAATGDLKLAEECYRRSLGIRVIYLGYAGADTAQAVRDYCNFLLLQNRPAEAEQLVRRCWQLAQQGGPSRCAKSYYLYVLATVLDAEQRHAEAASFAMEASQLKLDFEPAQHVDPKIFSCLLAAIRAYMASNQYDAAFDALNKAVEVRYQSHETEDREYAQDLIQLARIYSTQHRSADVLKSLRLAFQLLKTSTFGGAYKLAFMVRNELHSQLLLAGKKEEAEQVLREQITNNDD